MLGFASHMLHLQVSHLKIPIHYILSQMEECNQFEETIRAKYNKMERNCQKYDFGLKGEEILKKCNQCDYSSSRAGHLRTHLKTHSGERET